MTSVVRMQGQGKGKDVGLRGLATVPGAESVAATVALIQARIPLGLHAVAEPLEAEGTPLAGEGSRRTGGRPGVVRWGQPRGSVALADQQLSLTYRRVRDRARNTEVPLTTYQPLQIPRGADAGRFRTLRRGVSCRADAEGAAAVPAAFGLSPSTVSRRCSRVSARALRRASASAGWIGQRAGPWCNGVSGTRGSTASGPCPRVTRSPGAGHSRRPMRGRPLPTPRPPCCGFVPSWACATRRRLGVSTRESRRPSPCTGWGSSRPWG